MRASRGVAAGVEQRADDHRAGEIELDGAARILGGRGGWRKRGAVISGGSSLGAAPPAGGLPAPYARGLASGVPSLTPRGEARVAWRGGCGAGGGGAAAIRGGAGITGGGRGSGAAAGLSAGVGVGVRRCLN